MIKYKPSSAAAVSALAIIISLIGLNGSNPITAFAQMKVFEQVCYTVELQQDFYGTIKGSQQYKCEVKIRELDNNSVEAKRLIDQCGSISCDIETDDDNKKSKHDQLGLSCEPELLIKSDKNDPIEGYVESEGNRDNLQNFEYRPMMHDSSSQSCTSRGRISQ